MKMSVIFFDESEPSISKIGSPPAETLSLKRKDVSKTNTDSLAHHRFPGMMPQWRHAQVFDGRLRDIFQLTLSNEKSNSPSKGESTVIDVILGSSSSLPCISIQFLLRLEASNLFIGRRRRKTLMRTEDSSSWCSAASVLQISSSPPSDDIGCGRLEPCNIVVRYGLKPDNSRHTPGTA